MEPVRGGVWWWVVMSWRFFLSFMFIFSVCEHVWGSTPWQRRGDVRLAWDKRVGSLPSSCGDSGDGVWTQVFRLRGKCLMCWDSLLADTCSSGETDSCFTGVSSYDKPSPSGLLSSPTVWLRSSVSVFVLCPDTAGMPLPDVGVVLFEFCSYQSHVLTKTSSPYTSPRLRHFVLATQTSLRGWSWKSWWDFCLLRKTDSMWIKGFVELDMDGGCG